MVRIQVLLSSSDKTVSDVTVVGQAKDPVETVKDDKPVAKVPDHKNNPRGLMAFFDDPELWGEQEIKSGRPWLRQELRIKSNTDLHKLWFVLLKERNMLLTMKETSDKELQLFPSPERIEKVEESMCALEDVVRERNKAYWELEVGEGETGERRSVFRRDQFGRHRMYVPLYWVIFYHVSHCMSVSFLGWVVANI